MSETIRARVKGGLLEPLEPLEVAEGEERVASRCPFSALLCGSWSGA